MSERIGKIGLNAGTPWSLFAENTAFEDSDGMQDSRCQSTETTRLHREDMRIFGFCPARDNHMLVICKECQKIVQASASLCHYERKHSKMLSSLKRSPTRRCSVSKDLASPTRSFGKSKLLKSPGDNTFIRIEEVDPTDLNVKIEEAPLTIPKFNHASKGKLPKINIKGIIGANKGKSNSEKSPTTPKAPQKKQSNNKDKEYDPERHCGVWIEEQTRNCTRSLTCKTHSLSSRREVIGRSKSFDALLSDHKTRIQNIKESGSSSGTNTPIASPTKTSAPQFPPGKYEKSLSNDPRSPNSKENSRPEAKRHCSSDDHSSAFSQSHPSYIDYIPDDPLRLSSIPTSPHHPKPILVNTFSGRRSLGGCSFFTRKFEKLRWAAANMVEKCLKSSSQTSRKSNIPYKVVPGPDGLCSVQSLDNSNTNLRNSPGWDITEPSPVNYLNSSIPENSHLGPVPRVKTKTSKANSTGVKRQFSLNAETNRLSTSSRKRRHSFDPSKSETANKETNLIEEGSRDNNNIVHDSTSDLVVTMNEIGQVLNSLDAESLDRSLLSGSILSSEINQLGNSNLSISGGNISGNLNSSMNLNSSLTLCQTMGINPQIQPNPGLQATQLVVEQGQLLNQIVAPNVAVTQGMMVSLPNVTQVQNLTGYQGNLKEILPAPSPGKQINSSPGLYIATQGQNTLSQIPNGSSPSPENLGLSYSSGQSIPAMAMNISNKYANSTTSIGTKRYIAPSNTRVSQLVVRQPPLQSQRDQKASPFQKPLSYDQSKTPSPSAAPPTLTKSPLQQHSLSLAQPIFNNPQFNSTAQPITQLKQMQQQQQFMSPLNSVVQGDNLIYQQQILPKLTVSSGRSLQGSVATAQTLHVIDSSAPQGTSAL